MQILHEAVSFIFTNTLIYHCLVSSLAGSELAMRPLPKYEAIGVTAYLLAFNSVLTSKHIFQVSIEPVINIQ